jgi:hypothetical protein
LSWTIWRTPVDEPIGCFSDASARKTTNAPFFHA